MARVTITLDVQSISLERALEAEPEIEVWQRRILLVLVSRIRSGKLLLNRYAHRGELSRILMTAHAMAQTDLPTLKKDEKPCR